MDKAKQGVFIGVFNGFWAQKLINFILRSDQSFTVFRPDFCQRWAQIGNSSGLSFWKYTPLIVALILSW